jgi:plasmid stabilization system protein ParE
VKRPIVYTTEAEHDLFKAFLYGAAKWDIPTADAYIAGLRAVCESLRKYKELGRAVGKRRRFRQERHVIYYRVTKTHLVIDRVLHDAQLPKKHL